MENIIKTLKNAIKTLYALDFAPELTPSPDNIEADYSSNAPLKLAKSLHQAPLKIAEEIKDFLSQNDDLEAFTSAPGFINFILPDEYLIAKTTDLAANFAENISSDEYSGKTVICEFSDPNPFKVLHVGHLYTSVVGDAISRLYEYAGARVIRANFGGDVGLHVAKTMYALEKKNVDELTIDDIAKCYVEGTAAYEDSEEAKARITELNKEIYKINAEDLHDTKVAELYWRGRELSYEYFENFYASIGVKFDKFYPESTVAALGLATVKRELENGVYEVSDGAVIFDGEKFGLHTRVFINKEGVPTYEAKDVGLIFTKYEDYHFDKSVVITGNEQLEYMKVVLKSVEQYAPELVEKTSHLTHGLVKLPGNVKMSSRKGNFLKAVDVLNLVKDALKSEYNSTDETVSLAATKYAFLKYKMGLDIIFDPSESVKMTGNSGPYLLYSAVRAQKILDKVDVGIKNGPKASMCDRRGALASEPRNARPLGRELPKANGRERSGERGAILMLTEKDLAKKLLEYKGVLASAVTDMAPYKVANYLYELAQDFSRFYEQCPVAGSEQEETRVALVAAYKNVITHGLNLLGISVPSEM